MPNARRPAASTCSNCNRSSDFSLSQHTRYIARRDLTWTTTVIDEIVELHDRIIGALFNRAKRSHEQQFQQSGKAINEKVRLYWRIGDALLEAKRTGIDPFAAIESIIHGMPLLRSVTEAKELAQPENFDYLHRIGDRYAQVRRYAPAFLEALRMTRAAARQSSMQWACSKR